MKLRSIEQAEIQRFTLHNRYIEDDTKAAARRSPNCMRRTRRKTIFNMADGIRSPCNVSRGAEITPLNSNGGSTLQCGMWLWDNDNKFAKNVRHIGILLPVSISTISPQSTCQSAPVCTVLSKSDRPRQKNDVMSIFKTADLRHLGFQRSNNGLSEKPMKYFLLVVNRDHSSKMLCIRVNRVFAFWRQADKQMDRPIA